MVSLIWTIVVVLFVLWLLGFALSVGGGLIHLLLVLAVIAIAGIVVYRQMSPAPATMALLPEGDLLVYVNLKPAHFLDLSKTSEQDDPGYKDFVRQTGIEWGRDLDNIAISQHDPGANSDSAAVFTGHFDSTRLGNYLQKVSTGKERYADKTIYSIPH